MIEINYDILTDAIKESAKKEKAIQDMLKEYDLDDSIIDHVQIKFEPLDVSAKTVDGVIVLNDKLLASKWKEIIKYFAHELTHASQQATSNVNEHKDKDYLEDPNEISAFRTQIDYMEGEGHDEMIYSPEEIQNYLESLMHHHGLTGTEKEEKIQELLE